MISHKHKLVYFAVPKVARSSLKHMMYRLENGRPFDPKTADPENPDLQNIHELYPSTRHAAVDWDALDGFWRFAVVRDPIERIVSAYADKVVRFRTLVRRPPGKKEPQDVHALYEKLPKEPDLNTFCCNIDAYRKVSRKVDPHVCPFSRFLGTDLGIYDKVYRLEDLDQLAADLKERTGQNVKLPHRNQSKRTFGPEDLNAEGFDAISAYTKDDYALLDGLYERPAAPVS